jgi:hypothetical protein
VKNNAVKITIENNKTISDLQAEFNQAFPYLKVEFYTATYEAKKLQPNTKLIRHDKLLLNCRKAGLEGILQLNPNETVAAFEANLWEQYGLSVQVFRKSGNLWIETSLTDSWTLQQQNLEGEQMSSAMLDDAAGIDFSDRDQVD